MVLQTNVMRMQISPAIKFHGKLLRSLHERNPCGVWNFSTIMEAMTDYNKALGYQLTEGCVHGTKTLRLESSNLKCMLEVCRNIKKGLKTGERLDPSIAWIVEPIQVNYSPPVVVATDSNVSTLVVATDSNVPKTRPRSHRVLKWQISEDSAIASTHHYSEDEFATTKQFVHDWDEVADTGRRLNNGCWELCDSKEDDESGFQLCWWSDGHEWLSEEPVKIAKPQILKKPTAAHGGVAMKRPSGGLPAPVRKRIYSAAYHRVLKAQRDAGKSEKCAKEMARKAGLDAVEQEISDLR